MLYDDCDFHCLYDCDFHCLCYNNPERKRDMTERFDKIGVNLNVYDGVQHNDPRLVGRSIEPNIVRLWSVTYGHLDIIQKFYDSGKKYGFFCEDDIYINTDLPNVLPNIKTDFDAMDLDILLLGYMTTFKIEEWQWGHTRKQPLVPEPNIDVPYKYHNYHDNLWGVHLYMLSRRGAKNVLDKFAGGYADQSLVDATLSPFSPDWTISKVGNRALIYPMYGVENGQDGYEHYKNTGQHDYHLQSHKWNFIPEKFV